MLCRSWSSDILPWVHNLLPKSLPFKWSHFSWVGGSENELRYGKGLVSSDRALNLVYHKNVFSRYEYCMSLCKRLDGSGDSLLWLLGPYCLFTKISIVFISVQNIYQDILNSTLLSWEKNHIGIYYESINQHNSPIYDEYQTQSAKVLTLLWKRAPQDDSNDTPQPIRECQVDFPLLWIKAYPGLS